MRVAVIVQARYGSTRLPGKVLLPLQNRPALQHVLHRCAAISNADVVCCAVSEDVASDPVAELARGCGVVVFRGAEHDVLDRYYQAARVIEADLVMRITSDCPLIDPSICSDVVNLCAHNGADYACNNMPRSWPHGLDCEAFTFAALERAAAGVSETFAREHVTPWIRDCPDLRRVNLWGPLNATNHRWTLDYPEDLAFFQALFALLPAWPTIPATEEVLDLLAQHTEISRMNEGRRQA